MREPSLIRPSSFACVGRTDASAFRNRETEAFPPWGREGREEWGWEGREG